MFNVIFGMREDIVRIFVILVFVFVVIGVGKLGNCRLSFVERF